MPLPDYLGSIANARLLGGNPDTTDVADPVVIEALKFGFQQLIIWSGKSTWTGNERTVNQANTICEHFAGAWLRTAFRDPDNKSQELFNRGKALCVSLQENQKSVEDQPGQKMSHTSATSIIGKSTNARDENIKRYTSPRVDI